MNKLFLASALLLTVFASAQNKLNAFVGVNYSYFTKGFFNQTLAEESFGINVGANYEIPLTPKVAVRPGLNFAQVGDRTDSSDDSGSFTVENIDLKLSYLNVPLDFKFWNKIYLVAGPQISVRVNEPDVKRAEIGFNLGTGFKIDKLYFELGIYQGLTPVIDNFVDYSGHSENVFNGYGKFVVGYQFL